jgi:hypothetical protein
VDASVAVLDVPPVPAAGAVPGSVVPVRRDGLDAAVLAPDYRQIMSAPHTDIPGCRQTNVCRHPGS